MKKRGINAHKTNCDCKICRGRRNNLLKAEPIQAEPVEAEPIQAEPVEAEPIQAEPVEAEPIQAEPIQAEPIQAEPEPIKGDEIDFSAFKTKAPDEILSPPDDLKKVTEPKLEAPKELQKNFDIPKVNFLSGHILLLVVDLLLPEILLFALKMLNPKKYGHVKAGDCRLDEQDKEKIGELAEATANEIQMNFKPSTMFFFVIMVNYFTKINLVAENK